MLASEYVLHISLTCGSFPNLTCMNKNALYIELYRFPYMAITNERQRIMPTAQDRAMGQELDYPEAVLLTSPPSSFLKGEVPDFRRLSVFKISV